MANPYAPTGGDSATSNPYLQNQADAITNQVNRNLQNNILPGINSQAQAAGGYGGSRQGIAQGLAIGQTNQDLSNALAGLYGQQYQNDQNLGLGYTQAMNNFYTQNRQLDQSGLQLGANLINAGNAGYLGQGTSIYGIGQTQQQAQWLPIQNAGNIYSQFSGLGGGQTSTLSGSPLGGAVGGALAGAQIGRNLGFGSPSAYTTQQNNLASTGMNYAGGTGSIDD